ncbi:sulfatase family protein [Thermococcus sp.]
MERMNLVWIIADAARAENFSLYGYRRDTSPNLKRIVKHDGGTIFNDAYSVVNATDPSITSMLSGTYPVTHGIRHHGGHVGEDEIRALERRGIKFLQEYLLGMGYSTVSFDILSRWHRRGFKEYLEILPKSDKVKTGLIEKIARHERIKKVVKTVYKAVMRRAPAHKITVLDAGTVFEMAMERIKTEKDPFFYFIHLWDTHVPYNIPEEYAFEGKGGVLIEEVVSSLKSENWKSYLLSSFGGMTTEEVIGLYDGAIRFIDEKLAGFIDFLKDQGIYENTIIIFTADHGESLTEHGIYFDHHGLYDVSLRVPLVILNFPDGRKGHLDGLVQHVDLFPALAKALHLKAKHPVDGGNVFSLAENEGRDFIIVEENHTEVKRGIRTKRWKYIYAPDPQEAVCRLCGIVHGGIEELYDLKSDPGEERNIVDERKDVAKVLRETLDEWYAKMERRGEKLALKRVALSLRKGSGKRI